MAYIINRPYALSLWVVTLALMTLLTSMSWNICRETMSKLQKAALLKKFRFRCFVGDTPARSFATGTMGHAFYFGCPKCDLVCCSMGHKLYYQYFIGKLRTDESFRQRTDKQHKPKFQNRASLLERVMGMVSQFVIEAMHAVDLGVTKRISKAIFTNKTICKSVTKTAFVN